MSIPSAIRQQTWLRYIGKQFNAKCRIRWCRNIITPFDFEVGHDIPASRGGTLAITNLRPICKSCNRSMGNRYTILQWQRIGRAPPRRGPRGPDCAIM